MRTSIKWTDFYIIPYTSIIDQMQKQRGRFEDKTGEMELIDDIILEHHSNLTPG